MRNIKWPDKGRLKSCYDFSKFDGTWESIKKIYGIYDDDNNLLLELTKEEASIDVPLRFASSIGGSGVPRD